MRSVVQIVAQRAPGGATRLTRMRAEGMVAARRTGPWTVHLVGTAAGPLGGDTLVVRVHVGPGAALDLRSVAATIALPSLAGGPSQLRLEAVVEDGGRLHVALQALVVCRGADVRSVTELTLDGAARVRVVEQVVLGRHGEDGGSWHGRALADRDGVAVLRHTLGSPLCAPAGSGIRALVSSIELGDTDMGDAEQGPVTFGRGVACSLAAGGRVVTALGTDLAGARRDHANADPSVSDHALRSGTA